VVVDRGASGRLDSLQLSRGRDVEPLQNS
jgi:hypothetical protein